MLESLILDIEKALYPGLPMSEAVGYLTRQGAACHDASAASTWTTIHPRRTLSCTLFVKAPPLLWQVDVVLPEDDTGKLIRATVNPHKTSP